MMLPSLLFHTYHFAHIPNFLHLVPTMKLPQGSGKNILFSHAGALRMTNKDVGVQSWLLPKGNMVVLGLAHIMQHVGLLTCSF